MKQIAVAPSAAELRYLEPAQVRIGDLSCDEMRVTASTGQALGRVDGFLVDPGSRRLEYLLVRPNGLFGRTRMVPLAPARVDLSGHTIELAIDEGGLRTSPPASVDDFPPFSDEDALAAMFAPR